MARSDHSHLKIAVMLAVNGALMCAIAQRATLLRDAWRVHEVLMQSQVEFAATRRARKRAP